MTQKFLTTRFLTVIAGGLVIAACAARTPAPAAPAAPPAAAPAPPWPLPRPHGRLLRHLHQLSHRRRPPRRPRRVLRHPERRRPVGARAEHQLGRPCRRSRTSCRHPSHRSSLGSHPVQIHVSACGPDIGTRRKPHGISAWCQRHLRPKAIAESRTRIWRSPGKYVVQGNYAGILFWDVSNPAKPVLANRIPCPASQNDVSVYKHLLFVSSEGTNARLDCGSQGVPEPISKERIRGIRIFDISDIKNPKYVANVQTCRGSHTHTVLQDPNDKESVYIYVSGSAGVRSPEELAGCVGGTLEENPDSAQFRVEVIKVPLANPEKAAVGNYARLFGGLAPAPDASESPRPQQPRSRCSSCATGGRCGTASCRTASRCGRGALHRRGAPGWTSGWTPALIWPEPVPRHHGVPARRLCRRRVRRLWPAARHP